MKGIVILSLLLFVSAIDQQTERPPIIYYKIGVDGYDYVRQNMFPPFKKIRNDSRKYLWYKDSIVSARNYRPTPSDSIQFRALENKAYQTILQYKAKLSSAVTIEKPKGPPLVISIADGDESSKLLYNSYSKTFDGVDFMFLGGAPFVSVDEELYKDPAGNPEVHYFIENPLNAATFFNYAYSRFPSAADITYGPPLDSYKDILHVKKIGSLTHRLKKRIPAWILTAKGNFPGSIVSVNIDIAFEYGCVSPYPRFEFACPKNIPPSEVFGILMSDQPIKNIENGQAQWREENFLWGIDLDANGAIDIVRVSSSGEGSSSDNLLSAIWYARIDDKWVPIDAAHQPDCT